MPRVEMVAMSGFRVREAEMLELGMSLPGLAERAAAIGALPALGLLTLAGLTPDSWEIGYHDPPKVDDALVQSIVSSRPDLVAISALTASIEEAYALCASLRREGVRTVLGGLHITACPDEASRHADAIVVGDGESVWPQVLADAESGSLKPVYRADAAFDLASSPLPRFDLLGKSARPRYTLQTARGCPLACDFCGASRLLGGFREKPADRIAAELDAIRAHRPRPVIELADDNTFAGRRDAGELLRTLGDAGARWFTEADWRIGERPEILSMLASSGCVQVLVGIESMIYRYRGMGAKNAAMRRMLDAVERIQEAGVAVIGCFIIGGDGETNESLHDLAEFLIESPFADLQLTIQTPFPGTPLRERLAREGRLLPDRGWSACTLFDVTYQPDQMTVRELERGFVNLGKYVFSEGPASRRAAIRHQVWHRNAAARHQQEPEHG